MAQVYDRLNYQSSLSHARRLSTPTDKSGKLVAELEIQGVRYQVREVRAVGDGSECRATLRCLD